MTNDEMKIGDALKDPLIRQMMRADGISSGEMKRLLRDTARRQMIGSKSRVGRHAGR